MDINLNQASSHDATARRSVLYIITILYIIFVILRPHEYLEILQGMSIMPTLMIAGLLTFPFVRQRQSGFIQNKPVIVFVVIMSISLALSGWIGGIFITVAQFLPIIFLYFFTMDSVTDEKKVEFVMFVLVISAAVMAIHGIQQHSYGLGWTGTGMIEGRITYIGIFSDPNDLGQYFVCTIPMMIYLYKIQASLIKKLFYIFILCSVLYAAYLTSSRGTILSLAALYGIYLFRKYGYFISGAAGTILLILIMSMSSRLSEIDSGEESAYGRIESWYSGIEMLISNPMFGVGPGNFTEYNHLTAHNSYILVLGELGLSGYIVWCLFWGLTLDILHRLTTTNIVLASGKYSILWDKANKITTTFFYSILGFLLPAFFLSRSYSILLYLLCALSIAHIINVRNNFPQTNYIFEYSRIKVITSYILMSVVSLYLFVKILL